MQRYLADPYLIDGKKFDLRIYVLVTSFDPLKAYVFKEGLARFSTHNYTMKKLNSRFAHLTNYSVNKKSKHFVAPSAGGINGDNNSDMEGSKWSLTALWRYLTQKEGKDAVSATQEAVRALIVKTLVAGEGEVAPLAHRLLKNQSSCYEVFGFDVFLDSALKPWLIEVNVSPSLMGGSPLDTKIKGTLMADVFHLVGMKPYDESELKSDKVSG
jgi:tubulin polyglutamylase TTLL4